MATTDGKADTARADWAGRFAYAAELALRPPRDEHGHYVDVSAQHAVLQDWLDEHGREGPEPEGGWPANDWYLVAFEMPSEIQAALAGLSGHAPTDHDLSVMLKGLLLQYLRQSYALPE